MAEKKRILIIDDTTDITESLKLYLERTGTYEVRIARDGASGIAAVQEFHPDLILLDVVMPGMSGDQVATAIEQDEGGKRIPLVFLTAAVTSREVASRGGTIGGRPFLSKLTSLKQIVEYIDTTLTPTSRG